MAAVAHLQKTTIRQHQSVLSQTHMWDVESQQVFVLMCYASLQVQKQSSFTHNIIYVFGFAFI